MSHIFSSLSYLNSVADYAEAKVASFANICKQHWTFTLDVRGNLTMSAKYEHGRSLPFPSLPFPGCAAKPGDSENSIYFMIRSIVSHCSFRSVEQISIVSLGRESERERRRKTDRAGYTESRGLRRGDRRRSLANFFD